jgi:hypothetical protein
VFFFSFLFIYNFFIIISNMSSLAASQEPRLSKPGPLIADLSNRAAPATASHHAAAAEAERWIRVEISMQTAAESYPVITPPPETPISTTNSTGDKPLSPIEEDEDQLQDNLRDNLVSGSLRENDVNGKLYCYIFILSI